MSQTKAQLIQPIGVVTAGGVVVTGVMTASSFTGDVVGSATSIISGGNLNLGDVNATTFSGDFTGTATGINTGADIKVGQFTASSFTGDFTGTATSMFRGTGFKAGAVNATGFNVSGTSAGNITGNVTGNITGNVTGVSTGNVTGNVTGNITGYAKSVTSGANIHVGVLTAISFSGDGSNLSGVAATNYNTQVVPGSTFSINVTASGSSAYTLSGTDRNGSVSGSNASVSVEIGDTLNFVVDASGHPFYIRVSDGGANVSTPAATNQGSQSGTVSWTPNTAGTYYYQCGNHSGMIGTITVTATTTIDLSAGNMITFNQSANTTISFANTDTAMDITIIRDKDDNDTERTITWPDSVKWDGGTAPTLISNSISGDRQQFQLLTRDSGLTWYGWEPYKFDALAGELFSWGLNDEGNLGLSQSYSALKAASSPTQVGTDVTWRSMSSNSGGYYIGTKTNGTLWSWGEASTGALGHNNIIQRSSPTQIGTNDTWSENTTATEQLTSGGVKTDGTLWMWGNNSFGRLGQNQAPNPLNGHSSPTQIPGTTWSTTAGALSAGNTTFCIKTDGTAWAWGRGSNGSIGLNQPTNSDKSSPVQLPGTTWKQFAANGYNTGAVKTDGTMWTWGFGTQGRLGHNQETATCSSPTQVGTATTWKQIANAYRSFLAVKTDGTLWSWGYNNYGSLGLNGPASSSGKRSAPTQIGTDSTWAFCGANIEGGNMASKTDGTLWVWGRDTYGQMGQNTAPAIQLDLSSPTQIPGTGWGTTFNKFGIGKRHFSIIKGT